VNFKRWQRCLADQWCSRVYVWKVGRWIAEGRIKWRPNIFAHHWDAPGWPWIDEDKEVSAWAKKIDRGLATQGDALSAIAKDRVEHLSERQGEIIDAYKTAQEIEEATAGAITAREIWPHLAGLDVGRTERAVRAEEAPEEAPADNDEPPVAPGDTTDDEDEEN